MNILLLSVGTRNKIIQYFKREIGEDGRVIATDVSELAPAVYEADRFYKVPRITDKGYLDVIYDICVKEKIRGVLSLIDPELSLLAAHQADFDHLGVMVIASSFELCERSLDKFAMFKWLSKHNYACAKSFIGFDDFIKSDLQYPVFIKPAKGSASIAIAKADDVRTARFLFKQRDGMMIQEFLRGNEIGADVYVDMLSGEVVSIFTKRKLLMRAGETDKAISFKDDRLFRFIERFVKESAYRGPLDIDIFDVHDDYYISEVNPRFGGGYPHAYESGCNHMKMIMNNINGITNQRCIGLYQEGVCMMKYSEVFITQKASI